MEIKTLKLCLPSWNEVVFLGIWNQGLTPLELVWKLDPKFSKLLTMSPGAVVEKLDIEVQRVF